MDGSVGIALEAGSVDRVVGFEFELVTEIPPLPTGFVSSGNQFDLSVQPDHDSAAIPYTFLKPVTLAFRLKGSDVTLAGGTEANLVIQRYKDAAWTQLPTTVDFADSIAQTEVETLSIFALTIREAVEATDAPEPTFSPTPPPVASPTPTATPMPALTSTPTIVPTPTVTPTPVSPPTAFPRHELETRWALRSGGMIQAVPTSEDGFYRSGTTVRITATCGRVFGRTTSVLWAGDLPQAASTTDNPLTIVMDRDRVLVATCNPLPPSPTATPKPTPTPVPTPTLTPSPGFHLYVNGVQVAAGQIAVRVSGGNVILHQLAQSNGTYLPGSSVLLEAQPDVAGSPVAWQGVISEDGSRATVVMNGERFVLADITTINATPVPTATATPTATPTPVPTAGPTPTPTHTPTPLPPGVTPPPTFTPAPTSTPTPASTSGGTFILKWGSNGTGNGQFNIPRGIAIDASENVFVVDNGHDRIQKFDSSGTFLAKWGVSGSFVDDHIPGGGG